MFPLSFPLSWIWKFESAVVKSGVGYRACEQLKRGVYVIQTILRFAKNNIAHSHTYICLDVGPMFSHDGRTERWSTDGTNCLIILELLNISLHKVQDTKWALCAGPEMTAAM